MRFVTKRNILIIIALIFSIGFLWAQIVYASVFTDEDKRMASDLAMISGLAEKNILEIYKTVNDWQSIQEHIFVYKNIFRLIPEGSSDFINIYDLIHKNEPNILLSVLEFLSENNLNINEVNSILKQHMAGSDLGIIFAQTLSEKEYHVYKPAAKEQIKTWFSDGYLPEDILNADEIAKEKDVAIEAVLSLKTPKNTWDEIGGKFDFSFTTGNKLNKSLTVQKTRGKEIITGSDYEELVNNANKIADAEKLGFVEEIKKRYSLSDEEIENYQSRGFNLHEIQNAFKLAEGSKEKGDIVLNQKECGKSWEEIIVQYSSKKGGTD